MGGLLVACARTTQGKTTVGDFVMVQLYIVQLFAPLANLGGSYRMMMQAYLPTPPHISLHLPASPHISLYLGGSYRMMMQAYLPTSPYISPHLPTSPHISLYLPTSPYTWAAPTA